MRFRDLRKLLADVWWLIYHDPTIFLFMSLFWIVPAPPLLDMVRQRIKLAKADQAYEQTKHLG